MAAKVSEEVVSVYAGCPDISLRVTPDIKHAGRSSLVFVDLPAATRGWAARHWRRPSSSWAT